MLLLYGGYVAFGANACERADRAVMPIHWVGQSANYLMNNFSTSTEAKTNDVPTADKVAGWVRDFVLVASVGGGTCEPFNPASETKTAAAKSAPVPATNSVLNDGKPVFYTQGK